MSEMVKRQKTVMERAKDLGAKIKTPEQAAKSIAITRDALNGASDVLEQFSASDIVLGIRNAYKGRIEQQATRLQTLEARPFSRQQADAIGLAVVQSADLLRDVKSGVETSQAESSMENVIIAWGQALKEVIQFGLKEGAKAGKTLLGGVPWYVWLGGAYLLLGRGGRGRKALSL